MVGIIYKYWQPSTVGKKKSNSPLRYMRKISCFRNYLYTTTPINLLQDMTSHQASRPWCRLGWNKYPLEADHNTETYGDAYSASGPQFA
jgi:hypothetical protein